MDRWRNVVSWGKDGSDAGQSQYLGMFKDVSDEMGEDWGQNLGKLLLLGCENPPAQNYGLQNRKKTGITHDTTC